MPGSTGGGEAGGGVSGWGGGSGGLQVGGGGQALPQHWWLRAAKASEIGIGPWPTPSESMHWSPALQALRQAEKAELQDCCPQPEIGSQTYGSSMPTQPQHWSCAWQHLSLQEAVGCGGGE